MKKHLIRTSKVRRKKGKKEEECKKKEKIRRFPRVQCLINKVFLLLPATKETLKE